MKIILLPIILIVALSGCTTTQTQQRLLTEPMSRDLEAQVIRETVTSNTVGGTIIGGVGGFLTGFAAGVATGQSVENSLFVGLGTGVAGAVGGGAAGYVRGQEQGRQIVQTAAERDNAQNLISGAKAYNTRLANANQRLRNELAKARNAAAANRRNTARDIENTATHEIKDATKRIADRNAVLGQGVLTPAQAKEYQAAVRALSDQKNKTEEIRDAARALSTSSTS